MFLLLSSSIDWRNVVLPYALQNIQMEFVIIDRMRERKSTCQFFERSSQQHEFLLGIGCNEAGYGLDK